MAACRGFHLGRRVAQSEILMPERVHELAREVFRVNWSAPQGRRARYER
jgi:hypothetical protein